MLKLLKVGATLAAIVACASTAVAQGTTSVSFPDVPENHWAYQAVEDLASKGYVKGFPDGNFMGSKDMTRYEFATVIDRILQTIDDIKAAQSNTTQPQVTQDDLNKIQVLVDTFKPQLDSIQANVDQAQKDISDLRDQISALRQDVADAKEYAAKAKDEADNSYGTTVGRKYSITGLVESRFVAADSGSHSRFPTGSASNGAFNGNYAQGSVADSAEVRRARIIMLGQPTQNTTYKIQMDVAGAVNAPTANSQFSLLEAYGTYTFGNGSSTYPALSVGGFANPFGFILPASPAAWLTPERPLVYSEASNVGLWDKQDYDKGVRLAYGPKTIKFTYAIVNGSGRNSENVENHFDSIARVGYASTNKVLNAGVSYYNGVVDQDVVSATSPAPTSYSDPKKQLVGLDAEIQTKCGAFLTSEYVSGTYEKRSYFDEASTTKPYSLMTDPYVKGNQVNGYYIWGGYTFHQSDRPLTFGLDYDVFDRSHSGQSSGFIPSTAGTPFVSGGSSFDDVNWGYGMMYNLDKATRFRLWYERPTAVAHLPGTPNPPMIGLYTAEFLYRY